MQKDEIAAMLFAGLGHPGRLKIVRALKGNPLTVNEVAAQMHITQSGASQHLAHLARLGILKAEAHGTSRVYRLAGPRIEKILLLIDEFIEVHSLQSIQLEAGN